MDGEVGTYSKSGIREQRRNAEKRLALQERRLALQQRRLAALAKIDEGHEELEQAERENEELEQAEREVEALDREGTSSEQPVKAEGLEQAEGEMTAATRESAEPEQPAGTVAEEPETISERSKYIMMERPGTRHSPRHIADKMYALGWVDADINIEVILQRLRHSLPRLVARDPDIERDASGTTHYYWYVSRLDSDASVPVARIDGVSHRAIRGGGR
jgi:hypothetical protein